MGFFVQESVLFLSDSVTNFVLFPFTVLFVVIMKLVMQFYCNKSLMVNTNLNTNLPESYGVIIFLGYLLANMQIKCKIITFCFERKHFNY